MNILLSINASLKLRLGLPSVDVVSTKLQCKKFRFTARHRCDSTELLLSTGSASSIVATQSLQKMHKIGLLRAS